MNTLLERNIPFLTAFFITLAIAYLLDKKFSYTEKINTKLNFNEGYIPCFYLACGFIFISIVAMVRNNLLGFSIALLYWLIGTITALLTNSLIHSN